MRIDIDRLTEAELLDLHHRIVERLRFLQQARAHASMLEFRIGQRVSFKPEGRARVAGMVTRYNKKSVTVVTPDGQRWNVSPALLDAEPEQRPGEASTNVVQLPRKE